MLSTHLVSVNGRDHYGSDPVFIGPDTFNRFCTIKDTDMGGIIGKMDLRAYIRSGCSDRRMTERVRTQRVAATFNERVPLPCTARNDHPSWEEWIKTQPRTTGPKPVIERVELADVLLNPVPHETDTSTTDYTPYTRQEIPAILEPFKDDTMGGGYIITGTITTDPKPVYGAITKGEDGLWYVAGCPEGFSSRANARAFKAAVKE